MLPDARLQLLFRFGIGRQRRGEPLDRRRVIDADRRGGQGQREACPASQSCGRECPGAPGAGREELETLEVALNGEVLAAGRYTCQINLIDETGRKFAFQRTEIVVLPAPKAAPAAAPAAKVGAGY